MRNQVEQAVSRREGKTDRRSGPKSARTPPAPIAAQQARSIRRKLLNWYSRNGRDLPWRRRSNSVYAQWVAEIMLQQTRVETVADYYERFLERFPTVESLAAASIDDVLVQWQGLGYYRRAENLHRGARMLVERGQGWPEDAAAWLTMPGVGKYTAAAIASVTMGQRIAAVDGNVIRVLSRLLAIDGDVAAAPVRSRLDTAAMLLLPQTRAGDFNQACMDLGATICLPRSPKCETCPLAGECRALDIGLIHELPAKRGKPTARTVDRVVAAIYAGDRLLMRRRPAGGRWSQLWEVPNVGPAGDDWSAVLSALCGQLGLPTPEFRSAGTVTHALTHRSYQFHIYWGHLPDTGLHRCPVPGRRWARPADLGRLAVAAAHRKVLARLSEIRGVR